MRKWRFSSCRRLYDCPGGFGSNPLGDAVTGFNVGNCEEKSPHRLNVYAGYLKKAWRFNDFLPSGRESSIRFLKSMCGEGMR
jgi:hypothetical protein